MPRPAGAAKRKFRLPEAFEARKIIFDADSAWLAPLAGYSDLPFRLLCREYGALVCETEMVSAKGLLYESPGSDSLLRSDQTDQPLIVQLFGSEPETVAEAVLLLRRHGYQDFDFNMGCPVRKVMRQGSGAALLADPQKCRQIARAMLEAARKSNDDLPDAACHVGFKLRLPPDGASACALGRMLEDLGADWLTLHARTASQGYAGTANWREIEKLANSVAIPVIASGDLISASDGLACLRQTGANNVMYARGALRNPFIFAQHRAAGAGLPEPDFGRAELAMLIRRHIELTRKHCSEWRAFAKIRSILPRYVRHFAGVNRLRLELSRCADWEQLDLVLCDFLERT